jgi:hypothetical protein
MTRKLLALATAALAAFCLGPATANAGVLISSADDCADQSVDQNFIRWADVANYTLHPGGDFDSGPDWSLANGAAVVNGNDPYFIGDATGDSRSLSLPSGSSAKSGSICVGIEHPDMRFVARSNNPLATLRVDVLFEDSFGNVQSAPIGGVNAGSSWAPSVPLPIVVNLLPLLPGERTAVAFKFTASGGAFQVDDVYVDPYRSI